MIYLILILIAFPALIKIYNEISNQQVCPEDEVLKSVVLGRLSKNSSTADVVIKHLGICQKCRDKVKALNNS